VNNNNNNNNNNVKVQNIFHGRNNITNIVCLRYIIVNTLHKGDNRDDDNNRIVVLGVMIVACNIIYFVVRYYSYCYYHYDHEHYPVFSIITTVAIIII
jgi:hypothetical protein